MNKRVKNKIRAGKCFGILNIGLLMRKSLRTFWYSGLCVVLLSGCDFFEKKAPKVEEVQGGDESLLRKIKVEGDPRLYVETRSYMGELFRLIVAVDGVKEKTSDVELSQFSLQSRKRAQNACRNAFAEVARVERLMSRHVEEGQLSRLNRSSLQNFAEGKVLTDPFEVDEDVLLVIREAKQVSQLSKGAFDVTFAAVGDLWYDKEIGKGRVPSKKELARLLQRVDYEKVQLDLVKKTVRMAAGQQLGLGGIAKGYAIDRAVVTLKQKGYRNFVVYGGGDIYVSGQHPDRQWRVGIRHPRKKGEYFAFLDVTNVAVVTSADNERFFELEGERYHKVLDPKTGLPARGVRLVTVLSDRAVYSDAMATALFVMGTEHGRRLVDRLSDTEAVFVDNKNKIVVTAGLKRLVNITSPLKEKADGH